jgi:Rhodopirellula transposase DDE domain
MRWTGGESLNWRGRPLTNHHVILQSIAATTTDTGLSAHAQLDTGAYPTGVQFSDAEMAALPVTRHAFHSDWSNTLRPDRPGCVSFGVSYEPVIMKASPHLRWSSSQVAFIDGLKGRHSPLVLHRSWPGTSRRSPSERNTPPTGLSPRRSLPRHRPRPSWTGTCWPGGARSTSWSGSGPSPVSAWQPCGCRKPHPPW